MRGLEAVGVSRPFVYDVIYALAASEGRERVLFGSSAPLAHEAFGRSLVGDVFPELWFEVPLLGEPWFACYTGVFPGRGSQAMHVECIVGNALQRAYAADASLLRKHLADAGLWI